jgi:hypothetical protein
MKTIYKLILISACIPIPNACSEAGDSYSGTGDSVGRGGSMARFTIHDDYLYTVDNSTLNIFDLSNPAEPFYLDRRNKTLDFNIETIFNKDTLLFIGSQDGMYIYSIVAPDNPQPLSYVSHIRSCDPVVASGNYAYVTLNSQNTWCGGNTNALIVYDISDLRNPVEKYTVNLDFPKGLGIDGNKLFVCEAKRGIAVYDVSNPVAPVWKDDLQYITEANGVTPYDVIPADGLLLTSTDKGLYQFDYTGADFKLKFVSKLLIKE